MENAHCVVLLAVFLAVLSGQTSAVCVDGAVQNCTTAVIDIMFITSSNIAQSCAAFKTADACVKNTTCTISDSSFLYGWAGKQNVYTDICGASQTEFLQYQSCIYMGLMNNTDRFLTCQNKSQPAAGTTVTLSQACQSLNDQVGCYAYVTQSSCGNDGQAAAAIVTKYMLKQLQPIVQGGCTVTGQSSICNQSALSACVQQVNFLTITPANFDQSCGTFKAADTCINTNSWCNINDAAYYAQWSGSRAFLADICNNPASKTEYLQYQPCIATGGGSQLYATCMNQSQPGVNPTAAQTCQAYNNAIGCLPYAMQNSCGSGGTAAAVYITKRTISMMQPSIKTYYPTCVLTGYNSVVNYTPPTANPPTSAAVSWQATAYVVLVAAAYTLYA